MCDRGWSSAHRPQWEALRDGRLSSTMQRWVVRYLPGQLGGGRTVAPAGVVSTSGCGRGPVRAGGDASRASRTGRDHRPVDPTLLVGVVSQEWVSVVPAVGGKRRCPPSDTHFPDHHAWSWSDAARENGAPPQLRCQLCPGTVEPGEEECFNHSGTDQLGFVDAVVVPPAPRWRRASSTGKARIQVYSPACAPASSAMGMESKKMTGIGSDSQRT